MAIEVVSTRSWISVRDRVAKECGESAHKRMLADKNIKDPNNGGEFISGSKGWAIVLKKEYIYEKGRFIEAVIHELMHAYYFEKGFDEEVLTTIGELADGIKMKVDVHTTMEFLLGALSGNLQM